MNEVSVQTEDFDTGVETTRLRALSAHTGAIATFIGVVSESVGVVSEGIGAVSDSNENSRIVSLYLEHYPGMTEKSIAAIVQQAQQRWPLLGVRVIHRIGELQRGEQIVFVGVSSRHRGAAFDACEFIMDYLKTRAPFWKKETTQNSVHWVDARASDCAAAKRWESNDSA